MFYRVLVWLIAFIQLAKCRINYPINFTTLRTIDPRRPIQDIARLMTVPGYRASGFIAPYQFISFDGWTTKGTFAASEIWANAENYFGKQSRFGNSTKQIQQEISSLFRRNGTKLTVTAFSDYEFPLIQRVDAQSAAAKLALFVNQNNLDGATIQFEDLTEDNRGAWLVLFLKALKERLKSNSLIILQVFASNFVLNSTLSHQLPNISPFIDFFVVKYYNVLGDDYTTVETLTQESKLYKKTSVGELMSRGISGNKLVVGKPSSMQDTWNQQGFVSSDLLITAFSNLYAKRGWYGGYSNNDLAWDMTGQYGSSVTTGIWDFCDSAAICI